jgi:hypothetical protein
VVYEPDFEAKQVDFVSEVLDDRLPKSLLLKNIESAGVKLQKGWSIVTAQPVIASRAFCGEAISKLRGGDCFVALLLAMTGKRCSG